LGDLICIQLVMVYLDNILIFGTCLRKHRQLVKEVLKRLQFNDLYTKVKKYFFEQSSIKYLNIIISENKVQMDKKKLLGVLEWPVLTKVKQVQAFLGFVNFYCRFIKNFQDVKATL